jgi:hypothetical protein
MLETPVVKDSSTAVGMAALEDTVAMQPQSKSFSSVPRRLFIPALQ